MEFKKLMTSKTFEISKDLGVNVELTEGKSNNTLSIWLMYKNDEDEWAYKGTKNGATAIRCAVSKELITFLTDNLKAVEMTESKYQETKTKGFGAVTTKKIDELSDAELELLLAMRKKAKAEPKKVEPKAEPIALDDDLELEFKEFLKAKAGKKTKKSK